MIVVPTQHNTSYEHKTHQDGHYLEHVVLSFLVRNKFVKMTKSWFNKPTSAFSPTDNSKTSWCCSAEWSADEYHSFTLTTIALIFHFILLSRVPFFWFFFGFCTAAENPLRHTSGTSWGFPNRKRMLGGEARIGEGRFYFQVPIIYPAVTC